jgi:hypothetical protein
VPSWRTRYLARQKPAKTISQLQSQLDTFVHYYNDIRPHRALDGRTHRYRPTAPASRPKPAGTQAPTHFRVRNDKVDAYGKVSLRYMSNLHHIGLGRAHKGRNVKLLIADRSIRVITPDGELIRELTLDPNRDYQPLTHTPKLSTISRDTCPGCPETQHSAPGGNRTRGLRVMSRDQSAALCGSLAFAPLIRHFRGCGDCRACGVFPDLGLAFP